MLASGPSDTGDPHDFELPDAIGAYFGPDQISGKSVVRCFTQDAFCLQAGKSCSVQVFGRRQ
jgi:hypothetical protein